MKTISDAEVLALLQAHKVVAVGIRKCFNAQYKNDWHIDGMTLNNGQFIGMEGEGSITYWLAQPEDIKE